MNSQYIMKIEQILFDYNLYNRYEYTSQNILKLEQENRAKQQAFIVDIAKSYFKILLIKQQLLFSAMQLEIAIESLEEKLLQIKSTSTTNYSFVDEIKNYYITINQMQETENEMRIAYEILEEHTAKKNFNLYKLKKNLEFLHPEITSIDKILNTAKNNNAEMQSQMYLESISEIAKKAKFGRLLPKINIEINHSMNHSSNFLNYQTRINHDYVKHSYIGIKTSYNIFNGGIDYAIQKKTNAYNKGSYLLKLDKIKNFEKIVKSGLLEIIDSIKKIKKQYSEVKISEYNYENYKNLFQLNDNDIELIKVIEKLNILYYDCTLLEEYKQSYIINVLQHLLNIGTLSEQDITFFNNWLL